MHRIQQLMLLSAVTIAVVGGVLGCARQNEGTATRQATDEAPPTSPSPGDHHAEVTQPSVTPESALAQLLEGNQRFVAGTSIHPHSSADYRASLANEQHPFAIILTCSDSRVTPVLIFDQGIGDLFVIRVAGNVVDDDVAASIEYAVKHLGTKLVIIMGHENCGAVNAAYHAFIARDLKEREPHEIEALLLRLEPAVSNVDRTQSVDEQMSAAVEANVRLAVASLLRLHDIREAQDKGKAQIVGAIYSVRTGSVNILDL